MSNTPTGTPADNPLSCVSTLTWAVVGEPPDPGKLENQINQIAGVVTVGLFAQRPADVLLVGSASGVKETRR